MYNFRKIDKCNMCGSNSNNHKLLGKRFNRSQGIFLKKKSMIFLPIYINVLSVIQFLPILSLTQIQVSKDMKN